MGRSESGGAPGRLAPAGRVGRRVRAGWRQMAGTRRARSRQRRAGGASRGPGGGCFSRPAPACTAARVREEVREEPALAEGYSATWSRLAVGPGTRSATAWGQSASNYARLALGPATTSSSCGKTNWTLAWQCGGGMEAARRRGPRAFGWRRRGPRFLGAPRHGGGSGSGATTSSGPGGSQLATTSWDKTAGYSESRLPVGRRQGEGAEPRAQGVRLGWHGRAP